ncbi:MAG: hypothetical protein IKV67_01415 [Paludibacteraceae bacterium]|nr:hypothetical protein [Paludibacteraceae bacterium]
MKMSLFQRWSGLSSSSFFWKKQNNRMNMHVGGIKLEPKNIIFVSPKHMIVTSPQTYVFMMLFVRVVYELKKSSCLQQLKTQANPKNGSDKIVLLLKM